MAARANRGVNRPRMPQDGRGFGGRPGGLFLLARPACAILPLMALILGGRIAGRGRPRAIAADPRNKVPAVAGINSRGAPW